MIEVWLLTYVLFCDELYVLTENSGFGIPSVTSWLSSVSAVMPRRVPCRSSRLSRRCEAGLNHLAAVLNFRFALRKEMSTLIGSDTHKVSWSRLFFWFCFCFV
jgi:hypothetical protein